VAGNGGDSYIDSYRCSCSRSGSEKVDGNVERAAVGVSWEAVRWLTLDVVFGPCYPSEWGQGAKKDKKGVAKMIVKGGFMVF
jgi:hypothetical protein